MPKLIYTPKALDDLQGIKTYVSKQFGEDRAKICNLGLAVSLKRVNTIGVIRGIHG